MFKKIQNFAKNHPLIWALSMGLTSSILLIVIWIIQPDIKDNNYHNNENSKSIFEFIKMLFYFALLHLFFTIFTFSIRLSKLLRVINTLVFLIVMLVLYIYLSDNLEYLDERIEFIPVKEWTKNGNAPPEEEMSGIFYWFMFICLSFINITIMNLLPNKRK